MRIVLGNPQSGRRGFGGFGRGPGQPRSRGSLLMRLVLGGGIALFALISFYCTTTTNPVTEREERVAGIPLEQEVAMGLAAAPEMVQQMGGAVPGDSPKQQLLQEVGSRLMNAPYREGKSLAQILQEREVPWQFTFTLIDDEQTVNAFALPGGPVFMTEALFDRLENEAQVAGVLGHEIGHVIERHGLERIAKSTLQQQLVGAVAVAADDGSGRGYNAAMLAQTFGNLFQLGYSREDELESDQIGLRSMVSAGYDPGEMVRVMEILRDASGGRGGGPEFMQTHPHPESRIEAIRGFVAEHFPQGVPAELGKGQVLR